MRLRWRKFEKTLGARLKEFDARTRMTIWQRLDHWLNSSPDVPRWFPRVVFSLIITSVALLNTDSIRSSPKLWLAGMSLWGLFAAVARAGWLRNRAQPDQEYRTLWMLPLAADDILHDFLLGFVRWSFWLFLEFLLIYGVLALDSPRPVTNWIGAVVCAGLQAALSVALTLIVLALKIKSDWLQLPLLILSAVFWFSLSTPRYGIVLTEALNRWSPFGRINLIYFDGCVRRISSALGAWPLICAFAATLPFSAQSGTTPAPHWGFSLRAGSDWRSNDRPGRTGGGKGGKRGSAAEKDSGG